MGTTLKLPTVNKNKTFSGEKRGIFQTIERFSGFPTAWTGGGHTFSAHTQPWGREIYIFRIYDVIWRKKNGGALREWWLTWVKGLKRRFICIWQTLLSLKSMFMSFEISLWSLRSTRDADVSVVLPFEFLVQIPPSLTVNFGGTIRLLATVDHTFRLSKIPSKATKTFCLAFVTLNLSNLIYLHLSEFWIDSFTIPLLPDLPKGKNCKVKSRNFISVQEKVNGIAA